MTTIEQCTYTGWRRSNIISGVHTMATIRQHGNEELLDVLYIVPVFKNTLDF